MKVRIIFLIILTQLLCYFSIHSANQSNTTTTPWQKYVANNAEVTALANDKDALGTLTKLIYDQCGMGAAQVVYLMYMGNKSKSANYYHDSFLTSTWLEKVANVLTTGQPPFPLMNSFNIGVLEEVDRNYVIVHLVPALQALNSAVNSYVDNASMTTNINFTPGSFHGVVVASIKNNSKEQFGMYQQGRQIGTINPGDNDVALYGAAQGQGDVVFVPVDQQKGSWRLSFKKGSDITTIANSTLPADEQYSTEEPPVGTDAQFTCVQITQNDFPDAAGVQAKQMLGRTQCINNSQTTQPAVLELVIEDSISVVNQDEIQVINQETLPLFYPSIRTVKLLDNTTFPYLLLPKNLQTNQFISAWINFINLVTGVLVSNYKDLNTPDVVASDIKNNQQQYYVIKQEENYFSSMTPVDYGNYVSQSKVPIKSILGGLPGTEYIFTPDILDIANFNLFLTVSTTSTSGKSTIIDTDNSATTSFLINYLSDKSTFESFVVKNIIKPNTLGIKQVGTHNAFTVTGKSGFAKNIITALQNNPIVEIMLKKLKSMRLYTTQGAMVEFSIEDFLQNMQSMAMQSKSIRYIKPISIQNPHVETAKLAKSVKKTNSKKQSTQKVLNPVKKINKKTKQSTSKKV